MGCMKSKQMFPFPPTFEIERRHESEETFMSEERRLPRIPSPLTDQVQEQGKGIPVTNPVILKYAEDLAQEILSDALQQWACNNTKYHNIPYIENESPDMVG